MTRQDILRLIFTRTGIGVAVAVVIVGVAVFGPDQIVEWVEWMARTLAGQEATD